jgi:plastocyanin
MRASVVMTLLTIVVAACGGGGDGGTGPGPNPNPNPNPNPATCTSTSSAVTVGNNNFTPSCTTVAPGTTVTWTWASGGTAHNVTFESGTSSGDRSSGDFTRAFPNAGTFPFQCTLHGGMTGEIRVVAP